MNVTVKIQGIFFSYFFSSAKTVFTYTYRIPLAIYTYTRALQFGPAIYCSPLVCLIPKIVRIPLHRSVFCFCVLDQTIATWSEESARKRTSRTCSWWYPWGRSHSPARTTCWWKADACANRRAHPGPPPTN